MTFDLFVMVTNWEEDRVDTDDLDQGTSYCGVKNEKYPDKRAMGFPFDRTFNLETQTIQDLVENYPNMFTTTITITFPDGVASGEEKDRKTPAVKKIKKKVLSEIRRSRSAPRSSDYYATGLSSGVTRGGQRGALAPGATSRGRKFVPSVKI